LCWGFGIGKVSACWWCSARQNLSLRPYPEQWRCVVKEITKLSVEWRSMTQVAFFAGSAQWEAHSHSWLAAHVYPCFTFPSRKIHQLFWPFRISDTERSQRILASNQRCTQFRTANGCVRVRHNPTAKTCCFI
jgi:hypothetical protein